MLDRIAHACLRGKMYHPDGLRLRKNAIEGGRILQPCTNEGKVTRLPESRQPGFLQPNVVVGIEVIQPNDFPFAIQEPAGNV